MALADEVRDFLDARTTLTLACVDDEGPWAADVYYVRTGRDLVFLSSPKSRHSMAFESRPEAAGTVHGEAEDWRDIRGVQLEGTVERLTGAVDRAAALTRYLAKFPFSRELLDAGLARKVNTYRLRPGGVYFVDNARGIGERAEVAW